MTTHPEEQKQAAKRVRAREESSYGGTTMLRIDSKEHS
jgi:hypothetical protein